MIDTLQQLSADPNVDSDFRRILAGKKPTVQMRAPNADSLIVLQQTADLLCATDSQVGLLQMCYDLGRIDGKTEGIKESLATIQTEAA